MAPKNKKSGRSPCPITRALELIGDRWTMVVLRDMIIGKKRFSEFLQSPEGISTNVLTDRLNLMEQAGLITAQPYSEHAGRFEYELTPKGRDLHPVLQELAKWGNRHLPDTFVPPASFMKPS